MHKFKSILDVVRLVISVMLIISLFTSDEPMLITTCTLLYVIFFIRVIVFFVKRFRRKKQPLAEQPDSLHINIVSEEQLKGFYELICRLEKLTDIIESNGSYYEAQKHYIEIKRVIDKLNDEQLQDYQMKEILEVLNVLEVNMMKLELKR